VLHGGAVGGVHVEIDDIVPGEYLVSEAGQWLKTLPWAGSRRLEVGGS
jgi:hypothetical protein